MNRRRALENVRGLLSQPTAPFKEGRPLGFLAEQLTEAGLDHRFDRAGNLVCRLRRGRPEACQAWVAHTDHPGFIVERCEPVGARAFRAGARWFGGVLERYFAGARVRVHSSEGPVEGRIESFDVDPERGRVQGIVLRLARPVAPGEFGSWALPPFTQRGQRLVAPAVDDLAGCAAILSALLDLAEETGDCDVIALFTRGEEAGFVGAWGAARAGTLPRSAKVISLECSKALPGAEQGKGPVVRLGDASGLFTADFVRAVQDTARDLAGRDDRFSFQQRVMDGGSCEATLFRAHGHDVAGLALPLADYHNMGTRGLAPESIHEADYLGMVRLLAELGRRSAAIARAGQAFRSGLEARIRPLARWLEEDPGHAPQRQRRRAP